MSGIVCGMPSSPLLKSLPAFVFDIDGVCIRGSTVLSQATRALGVLYDENGKESKYPVAFLTNSGGTSEARKAEQLSKWLRVHVKPNQVVLSHSPFQHYLPSEWRKRPTLIAGRGDIGALAKSYGYEKTVTTDQLAEAYPASIPFSPKYKAMTPIANRTIFGTESQPINTILVFNDPSDWYQDLQLMVDIILGRGVLGKMHHDASDIRPPVSVVFSNGDLLWVNDSPTPRFGQGAFALCLTELIKRISGKPLNSTYFGKPQREPYELIEKRLNEQVRKIMGREDALLAEIYAVGDNCEADIRGANGRGHPWVSILVETGVFQKSPELDNCPFDPADIVVEDIEQAVQAALHRWRHKKWHSLR